jgi:fibronectin-binding autotransporter adhesin
MNNSTAGNSAITTGNSSGSETDFEDSSTAGNATITTKSGGFTVFLNTSTGGNARFITDAGGTVNFSGSSGPLGDGNISAGSIEGAGTYQLGANRLTVGSNDLSTEVSGVISGSGGSLVKVGAGTLTLSGANTYSGGTTLSAGTLAVGNSAALGTGALIFASGTTLQAAANGLSLANAMTLNGTDTIDTQTNALTLAGTISGTGGLTKIGNGTLTLSGNNLYSGGTALNAGTLAVGSSTGLGTGDLTFANGTTLQAAANGLSLANAMTLNGTSTVDTQANALTLSGNIVGTGGLSKIGAGTLTLSGPSTYTGATNVNAGTLQAGVANAFSPLSAFTVASGAMLDFNGFDQAVGSLAGAGAVTLGAATLFTGGDNTSTTFSGTISGSGALFKLGPGTLTLTGASTYAGGTMIAGGLVNFNSASNFGTGPILLNGGGLQWAAGTSTDISSRLTPFGAGGATFDTNGNNVMLASALSGIGGVTKLGAGTLTLSGASSYSGATMVNRHAHRERLDRQFGCDGELGRHALRHRHGGRDHDHERRHVRARQLARHHDGRRQSRLPVGRALCRAGQFIDRIEHQCERQRDARRHGAGGVRVGQLCDADVRDPVGGGRARRHHVQRAEHEQSSGRLYGVAQLHRDRRNPEPHRHARTAQRVEHTERPRRAHLRLQPQPVQRRQRAQRLL